MGKVSLTQPAVASRDAPCVIQRQAIGSSIYANHDPTLAIRIQSLEF